MSSLEEKVPTKKLDDVEKIGNISEAKSQEVPVTLFGQMSMKGENLTSKAVDDQENQVEKKSNLDLGDQKKLDSLPDGTIVKVQGDPEGYQKFNHIQGENDLGFQGTCGLVSCEDVLKQYGKPVSENDIVNHANDNNLCKNDDVDPRKNGGTSPLDQAKILSDHGVPSKVYEGGDLNSLIDDIDQKKGAIIEVNAGVLWNDPNYFDNGEFNHAVVPTGYAKDAHSGELAGFYINDSGTNESGKFVDKNTMTDAWVDTGGFKVVADDPHE